MRRIKGQARRNINYGKIALSLRSLRIYIYFLIYITIKESVDSVLKNDQQYLNCQKNSVESKENGMFGKLHSSLR